MRNVSAVRCQPIKYKYKVAQVPKKLISGGGGGGLRHFFSDLKIFASILQAHTVYAIYFASLIFRESGI